MPQTTPRPAPARIRMADEEYSRTGDSRAERPQDQTAGEAPVAFVRSMLPKARDRLITINGHAPLTKAAELLFEPCRRMVVVGDAQGALIGVITRTDIIRQIRYCQGCTCTTPCTAVMTTGVISCRPEHRLDDTWSVMKANGLHSVPVIDRSRKPIGLLSARDALEALLASVVHQDRLLKEYVMCVGYR